MLEQAELCCRKLMAKFDPAIRIPSGLYNQEFAVADLKSSIESLPELREFSGGDSYRREVEKSAPFLLEKIRRIDRERRFDLGKVRVFRNLDGRVVACRCTPAAGGG